MADMYWANGRNRWKLRGRPIRDNRFSACVTACLITMIAWLPASSVKAAEAIKDHGGVSAVTCNGVWLSDAWNDYTCVSFIGGDGGSMSGSGVVDWGGGVGGGATDTSVAKEATSKDPIDCDKKSGSNAAAQGATVLTTRPVLIASGTKVLPELDFLLPPEDFPLKVGRGYNKDLTRAGAFGMRWSSNIEHTLSFEYGTVMCNGALDQIVACSPGSNPLSAIYLNGEGGFASKHSNVGNGQWTHANGTTIVQSGSQWIMTGPDGDQEVYDLHGRPITIKNERGIGLTYAYNGSNKLATITHTTGRSISITWSGSKISAITAPNGKAYGYGYNASGYLASVVYPDSLGTRTYHYEDSTQPGGLTGVSINGVRYSRYQYRADGKVNWSGLEAGIERSSFTYTSNYTEVTNALGHKTHFEYAEVGGKRQLIWIERTATPTCAGSLATTTYDVNGNRDIETDHFGAKSDYDYDADGRQLRKVAGIGPNSESDQQQITQYIWDATRKTRLNQIKVFGTSTSQPLSTTTYTYYPDGDTRARLLQSVAVSNHGGGSVATLTTTYSYTVHASGLIATMTVDGPLSGTGDAVTSTYDTAGNLLTVKNSLNHTTTYSNYNPLGQPGTITSANGAVVSYTYNARGQVLTETRTVNGVAQTTTTAYDTRGRPVSVTTPDGEVTVTGYDAYDRVTSVSKTRPYEDGDPDTYNESMTQDSTTSYNLLSQPTTTHTTLRYEGYEWDPIRGKPLKIGWTKTHHKTVNEYDAGGFLSKRKGDNGQSVAYHYNANGDVDTQTNALGHATAYAYDRQRRVSSITDANNGVTLIGYNALGLTTSLRDPRNNSTSYAYDGLGNLLSQTSPDTGATTFTYNSLGQRTQMQRADLSTTAYTYDTLGRLKTTASGGQTRTLTYDTCSNGKGMLCTAAKTGGTATTANFSYTPWGQLATRQDILSGVTDTTAYSYDGLHRLSGISYPSGVSVGYGYAEGNLSAITATVNGVTTTVASLSSYRAFGPAEWLGYGNGLWRQTNYDSDNRVTGISVQGDGVGLTQSLTYAFDTADRLTDITNAVDPNETWDFGYDPLSRLVSVQSPVTQGGFGYDAIGNRISRSSNGVQNATLTYPSTSSRLQTYATSGLTRTYGYNPNGDTTAMTGTDGIANTFAYDPLGRLASHTRSGVTTTYTVNALDQRMAKSKTGSSSRYVYAGFNQLLAEYTNGAWSSYIYNGGEPVALVRNGQIHYVHNDHLGRPESVTNASKAVVWKATNGAFSRSVVQDTIGGLNLGFPGQYWDSESSVWHNGYRDYEQTGGRYLQSDPIGLVGGINTYAYVGGNPVNMVDPLGLDDVSLILMHSGQIKSMPDRRGPDYFSLSATIGAANVNVTLTRNGTVFTGGGFAGNPAKPLSSLSAKPGISLVAGYMDGCPKTGKEVDGFVNGQTTTYGGMNGIGASRSVNSSGSAINIGFGTPGVGMDTTFVGPAGNLGVVW